MARAEDALDLAHKAIADLDYGAARIQLAAARDAGGHSREETAEIYRLLGMVDAALGDAVVATGDFARFLTLVPRATLPAGTSPKITRPFAAAAARVADSPALEVRTETTASPPTITLFVTGDPLGLVARAHVIYSIDGGAEQSTDVTVSERTDIVLPAARAGARIDARLTAVDDHGNRLVEIGSKSVPIVILGERPARPTRQTVAAANPRPTPPSPSRAADPAGRPLYLRWWPYAAATAVFAGGAVGFGLAARSNTDELKRIQADSMHHTFPEAKAVEDRGRRDALITNLALGAAGACAIAAGVMYLIAPGEHAEARLSAAVAPGGATVTWGATF